jgi:Tfp pilus assembly protein PilF
MRFTPAAVSLAVLLAVSSSISHGQKPSTIDPRATQWSEKGVAAFTAGKFDAATDAYETSLALDPANRVAFMGLAQVAQAQALPGKAIRYYDEALQLDPKDVNALEQQGLAMLDKGAVESAKNNLAKIKENCRTGCAAADKLATAIATNGTRPPRIVAASDKAAPGNVAVKE